jgi:hypothetical protein
MRMLMLVLLAAAPGVYPVPARMEARVPTSSYQPASSASVRAAEPERLAFSIASRQKPPTEVAVTGCLTQGSNREVFILEHARTPSQSSAEPGTSYVVARAAGTPRLDLAKHLNKKVTLTGTPVEMPAKPAVSAPPPTSSAVPQAEGPAPAGDPAGAPSSRPGDAPGETSQAGHVEEDAMPRFNARAVTAVAEACSAA